MRLLQSRIIKGHSRENKATFCMFKEAIDS